MVKKALRIVVVLFVSIIIALLTSGLSVVKFDNGETPYVILSHLAYSPTVNQTSLCLGVNQYNNRQSGWPLRYKYGNIDNSGCGDVVYPLIFSCDALFFIVLFSVMLFITSNVKRRRV